MNIIVALNPVFFSDPKRAILQENALRVLAKAPKNVFPVSFGFVGDQDHPLVKELNFPSLNILKRDSKTILKTSKKMPYIDEILNHCAKLDCDVFGYINSDILMGHNVYSILDGDYDAFILPRYDIAEVSPEDFLQGKVKIIYGGNTHCGADGFFFRKDWWIKNGEFFTDKFIIGEPEWDLCYRYIIQRLSKRHLDKRSVYHVYHAASWNGQSIGAKNNIQAHADIKAKIDARIKAKAGKKAEANPSKPKQEDSIKNLVEKGGNVYYNPQAGEKEQEK